MKTGLNLIVQRYFDAWKNQSVSELSNVFEKDAIYYEKPFQKPIKGLAAIKTYWKDHVVKQRNINNKIIKTFFVRHTAICEWISVFDFEDKHYKLQGILYLTVNPKTGLASRLVEYFRTAKTNL